MQILPLPSEVERLFQIDPQLKEKHIKADQKKNNKSEEIMINERLDVGLGRLHVMSNVTRVQGSSTNNPNKNKFHF